ncbi:hypothetical protein F1559_003481 [Cyanidiococcus yangmingshanensis]|uniref:Uncharacterized protein n=1 Tax=Cyanidiococcus yangmingshanensis TaxID=2690220 RepID=A0A7J7IMX0_9RHOD|nr:hypothetical protein F1559_003481 [Cyanidiococcus yangmingshanensis]
MENGIRVRFPTPFHVRMFASVVSCLSRCQTACLRQRAGDTTASESFHSDGLWFSTDATCLTVAIHAIGCAASVAFRRDFFPRECGGRLEALPGRVLSIAIEPVYWWPIIRAAGSTSAALGIGRKGGVASTLATTPAPATASGVPVEQLEVRVDVAASDVVLDAVASASSLVARQARGPAGFHDARHWRFQYRFRAPMHLHEQIRDELPTRESYSCRLRFAPRVFLDALSNMHRQIAQVTFHFEPHQLRLSSAQTIRNGPAVDRCASHYRDRSHARAAALHTQVKIDGSALDIYEGFPEVFQSPGDDRYADSSRLRAAVCTQDPASMRAMTVPMRPFKAWLELGARLDSAVWMLYEPGGALLLRLDLTHSQAMMAQTDGTTTHQVTPADAWSTLDPARAENTQPWLSAEMRLVVRGDLHRGNASFPHDQLQDATWLAAQDGRQDEAVDFHRSARHIAQGSVLATAHPALWTGGGTAFAHPLSDEFPGDSGCLSAWTPTAQGLESSNRCPEESDAETSMDSADSVGGTPPPMTMMPV